MLKPEARRFPQMSVRVDLSIPERLVHLFVVPFTCTSLQGCCGGLCPRVRPNGASAGGQDKRQGTQRGAWLLHVHVEATLHKLSAAAVYAVSTLPAAIFRLTRSLGPRFHPRVRTRPCRRQHLFARTVEVADKRSSRR